MFRRLAQRPSLRQRRAARPSLEAVESRVVMSASAAIVGNQLVVTGDNSGNFIEIDHDFQDTVVRTVSGEQRFGDFQLPSGIVINSGTGEDLIDILATEKPITVNGQSGHDNVIVGKGNKTDQIRAEVFVTNSGSFTTLQVVDNLGEFSSNIKLNVNTNIALGTITGLGTGKVTYRPSDIANLNVFIPNFAGNSGLKGNTVTIDDTFKSSSLNATTTISEGFGNDVYNIHKTTGLLTINANVGDDSFNIGSVINNTGAKANTLDTIQGRVLVSGDAGKNSLTINDQGSTTPHTYTLFGGELRRSGAASIFFSRITGSFTLNKGPVKGAAPQAKGLSVAKSAKLGQAVVLSGKLVDADKADALSVAVDWGDGSAPSQASPNRKPFALKHKFTQEGPQTVRVIWTDSQGESNFQQTTLNVVAAKAKVQGGKAKWA